MSKKDRTGPLTIGSVKKGSRESQEGFLRNRGWARLVERADIWVNTLATGWAMHDVYLFEAALEMVLRLERIERQKKAVEARLALALEVE